MPAPDITPLPEAPQREDTPAVFVTKADAFVAALEDLPTEINAFGDYLDGLALSGVSGPITGTALTVSTGKLLGRSTASTGAIEEIAVGSGLTLAAGTLSASGSTYTAENARDDIGAALTSAGGTVTITANDGADTIDIKITSYSFGFSIVSVATAGETVAMHIAGDAFTIPANFSGSVGDCDTNPTASYAIDVQRKTPPGAYATIGTITISTGGAFTFATASGTSKAIAAGDVLKFVAPSPADATAANITITIKGAR